MMNILRHCYVLLLDLTCNDLFEEQMIPRLPLVAVAGEEESHLQEVLDSICSRNRLRYLVK